LSRYQKDKTNLDLLEQAVVGGGGISWAIRTSAPHPRQKNYASTPPLSCFTADSQCNAKGVTLFLAEAS